jgi:hypothetical protein
MSLLQEMQQHGLADCEYNRKLIGDQTMEYQTVLIGDNELSRQDLNSISEMVHDALREIGIEPESFAWHIEVEYTINK